MRDASTGRRTNPTILHEAAVSGMLGVQPDRFDRVHSPLERGVHEGRGPNRVQGHIARRMPGEDGLWQSYEEWTGCSLSMKVKGQTGLTDSVVRFEKNRIIQVFGEKMAIQVC